MNRMFNLSKVLDSDSIIDPNTSQLVNAIKGSR